MSTFVIDLVALIVVFAAGTLAATIAIHLSQDREGGKLDRVWEDGYASGREHGREKGRQEAIDEIVTGHGNATAEIDAIVVSETYSASVERSVIAMRAEMYGETLEPEYGPDTWLQDRLRDLYDWSARVSEREARKWNKIRTSPVPALT